ncbi:hypothetical protein CH063_03160 [Colletotrichum higginsianum]|uniref:Uncharacterized protein n=1 Tax=Colletotrichum higginsianum (strain IMI 349063) TaxID=759273 RepID=H1VU83_COLHI|nr:hypothetical protein CH063_03160 [Colletotrichum higginsianum]
MPMRGSSGTLPRNGTPISSASARPPPVVARKISLWFVHLGHTKPAMFSASPSTRMPALRQKSISLRTSSSETS